MIEELPGSSGSAVGYRFSGDIDKADYATLVPRLEQLVSTFGSIQLLCDLTDFHWEKVDAWGADMRFGHEFHASITRMAMVGGSHLVDALAKMAQPFYAREVRAFPDVDTAWVWVRGADADPE